MAIWRYVPAKNRSDFTDSHHKKLNDYVRQQVKTSEGLLNLDAAAGHLVSGINCEAGPAAFKEMKAIRRRFDKERGRKFFHFVQSWKPNEVTPELAHRIGRRMAEELFGENFQVTVATHIDRQHIHNHFIVNAVSFIDGHHLNYNLDYRYRCEDLNDQLCQEHGLDVVKKIKQRRRGQSKKHENREEQQIRKMKNSETLMIRQDFERAVLALREQASSFEALLSSLERQGYQFEWRGQSLRFKAPTATRWIRFSSLDEACSVEALRSYFSQRGLSSPQTEDGVEHFMKNYLPSTIQSYQIKKAEPNLQTDWLDLHLRYVPFRQVQVKETTLWELFLERASLNLRCEAYICYRAIVKEFSYDPRAHLASQDEETRLFFKRWNQQAIWLNRQGFTGTKQLIQQYKNWQMERRKLERQLRNIQYKLHVAGDPEERNMLSAKKQEGAQELARLRYDLSFARSILKDAERRERIYYGRDVKLVPEQPRLRASPEVTEAMKKAWEPEWREHSAPDMD